MNKLRLLVFFSLAFALAGKALAQTPDFIAVTKEVFYWQSQEGQVQQPPNEIFAVAAIEGVANGSITNPRLTLPNLEVLPLEYDFFDNAYYVDDTYTSLAELDENVPNGTYRIAGTGNSGLGNFDVALTLSGSFSNTPIVSNYNALQNISVSEGLTLNWNAMVSSAPHQFVQVSIWEAGPSGSELYNSGLLPGNLTSVTIPSGVLPDNTLLQAEIGFIAASQFDEGGPGGATVAAGYIATTEFQFTSGSGPAPDPAIAFFGQDLYVFPGTVPGTSAWYFSFTFKDLYHFAGNNWFYSLEFNSNLWIAIDSGNLSDGFWSYFIFPEGNTAWGYMARNGNFYDLRDTNKDGNINIPDSEAGSQRMMGYIFLDTPFPGDPAGPQWYYFEEFDDGNWVLNLGIADPQPSDWHQLR